MIYILLKIEYTVFGVMKLKRKEMTVEDAKIILFENKKANKHIWDKYDMPYETAAKTLKKDPKSAHLLKEKALTAPAIASALTEAGIIGLSRNAKFNADRNDRRKIIADRIKQIRQMNKLTQEEISDKIEWNTLTYRGYENCKSDVPMVILIRLADYYGVSMDYLTGRTDYFRNKSDNNTELEQRISKLENMLEKLSEK